MRNLFLFAGLLTLIAMEILRVYFIMPFPGSQQHETLPLAYWLDRNISWLRIILLLVIAYPIRLVFRNRKSWPKWILGIGMLFYVAVFYLFNFRFLAEKMFYQPSVVRFAKENENTVAKEKLVLSVVLNGEAKAYPIQLIGYHHQVRDRIGGEEVMVTYCTVCRTGRVYSPMVNGKTEDFRLVGMDHFNALFEDATTKSWWRQATGEAVAGPLTGQQLREIPSQQMTLGAWLEEYPNTAILQPDTLFQKQYNGLANYDLGTLNSSLEKRDSGSWKFKSWVIGIDHQGVSKAYDWNRLVKEKIIIDSLPGLPLMLVAAKEKGIHYAYSRNLNGAVLSFQLSTDEQMLIDQSTGSMWDLQGVCREGTMKGAKLNAIQSYQEFWHSWKTFHPQTQR